MKGSTKRSLLALVTRTRETEIEAQDYLAYLITTLREAGATSDEIDRALHEARSVLEDN